MREALKKGIKYEFNKEIKKEFKDRKKEIMDAGFLEPYDPKKRYVSKLTGPIQGWVMSCIK